MKKRAPPGLGPVANSFYAILFLIGLGAVLAALWYVFSVVQPRLWGVQVQAQSVKYYAFEDNPENRKQVDYTFTVKDKQYSGTQEIGELAYKQRLSRFTVWYRPDQPTGKRYVAIRDYSDTIAAGLGALAGVLFMYLPKFGRTIDAKIAAGKGTTTMQGCVCGQQPRLQLKVAYVARKNGMLTGILIVLSSLLAVFFAVSSGSDYWQLGWLGIVLLVAFGGPFLSTFWRWRKHSFRCALRRASFQALFWAPATNEPIREVQLKAH